MFYYLISGWDNRGNQVVYPCKANSEHEAEIAFMNLIGGGEVNEILDQYDADEYEAECKLLGIEF